MSAAGPVGFPPPPGKGLLAVSDSTALQPFDFKGREVRVVMLDSEPWFVAADACKALKIADARQAVERLDQDERCQTPVVDSAGRRNPNAWVVNESGLYALVIRSDKPEAREFRRWITREVLPSIRRTGMYAAPASTADGLVMLHQQAAMHLASLERMIEVEARVTEQAKAIEAHEAQSRDHDARLAAIEGRHDWYSALGYARLHQLPTSHVWLNRLGVTAGTIGRRHGLQAQKVQHSLFGEVNSWPEWVWTAAVEARRAAGDTMGGTG